MVIEMQIIRLLTDEGNNSIAALSALIRFIGAAIIQFKIPVSKKYS
jgi:hypothetical protein